jgi:hypothetical protein
MKQSHNLALIATLSAAMLFGSSLAMAGMHGDRDHRGEHHRGNMAEACEQFRDSKMPERHQQRLEQMEERHGAMADRLKLNDQQREIWNQIHQERKEKFGKNAGKWQEKMQKRCQKAATDK